MSCFHLHVFWSFVDLIFCSWMLQVLSSRHVCKVSWGGRNVRPAVVTWTNIHLGNLEPQSAAHVLVGIDSLPMQSKHPRSQQPVQVFVRPSNDFFKFQRVQKSFQLSCVSVVLAATCCPKVLPLSFGLGAKACSHPPHCHRLSLKVLGVWHLSPATRLRTIYQLGDTRPVGQIMMKFDKWYIKCIE